MKRKVILYISQSLDGFIADSKGNVDWILGNNENYDSDYGYETFIKDIDTVILGANTYKQIKNELIKSIHCSNSLIFVLHKNRVKY